MKLLDDKIKFSINLIQNASKMAESIGQPLEVCYSGGKDSDVILELTKMANVPYRAIYKNTTIDPPGTIKHCKEKGVEIFYPKMNFAEIIQKKGLPSRFARFCCSILKEYKILDYALTGIRRDESTKRKSRYKEPEICRVYSKDDKCRMYMPILYWSQDELSSFILSRKIRCHPLYYDDKNEFHPERRLGCLCCPIASRKKRLIEFEKYPNMVKYYANNADIYLSTHRKSKCASMFSDGYEWFFYTLFCDNLQQFKDIISKDMFGQQLNCKSYLEHRFGINF